MLLSQIITKLQDVLLAKGDMEFMGTVTESSNDEDCASGKDFVGLELGDPEGDPYCELIMETNAAYRIEREQRNKEA